MRKISRADTMLGLPIPFAAIRIEEKLRVNMLRKKVEESDGIVRAERLDEGQSGTGRHLARLRGCARIILPVRPLRSDVRLPVSRSARSFQQASVNLFEFGGLFRQIKT